MRRVLKGLAQIRRHFNSDHCAPGYAIKVTELPQSTSNRYRKMKRYSVEITGPCSCRCGEIVKLPWTNGQMPDTPPPYFKSGHMTKATKGNCGSFRTGSVPWNKGKEIDMPRNSGMFQKGHLPANYKGGISANHGVVMRLAEGLYPCGVRRRVNVAREVGARLLGRPLRDDEVATHRDGNWRNNAPGNIVVMTRSESINTHRSRLLQGRTPRVQTPRARTVKVKYHRSVPELRHKRVQKVGTIHTGIRATRGGQFCEHCHRLMSVHEDHVCVATD